MKSLTLAFSYGVLLASAVVAAAQSYTFTTLAGAPLQQGYVDGTNGDARFNVPVEMAIDSSGAIYVADNQEIRKMVRNGSDWVVTTIPASFFCCVRFVAVDVAANLYVSDPFNNAIQKPSANRGVLGCLSPLLGRSPLPLCET